MHRISARVFLVFLFILLFLPAFFVAEAERYQSSSFNVRDPVLFSGTYSTSTNYRLNGVISQIAVGTSSITDFKVNSGFLFYPFVTTPTVTATAGSAQVSLSWTASEGFLGWVPTTYTTGRSTAAGGPYTLTNVGNVTSATVSGLTNGTTYYFVIRVNDAFGNGVATSSEVSSTPAASGGSGSSSGSSSGGGGGGNPTQVIFRGRAYPGSIVTLLQDGQVSVKQPAGPDAKFDITLSNLTGGSYNFGVYSEDKNGRRSIAQTFPITLSVGATTVVGGIFLSPTIGVDKEEVRRGDDIAIFGQSVADAQITISVNSFEERFVIAKSDRDGVYLYNFDTAPLELGSHTTKSKAASSGEVSPFSHLIGFKVGTRTIPSTVKRCPDKADVNSDCRVNLIDFSITAYWYRRTLSTGFREIEKTKLSGDGKVNLTDFSIMAYYWTG
ncbi:MAG: hypothetical protein HYT43_01910 [Candidatus Taylorbacteria bacterium]|nr:hypothetical protein [Candidatus Taylorbacteria bacterium]